MFDVVWAHNMKMTNFELMYWCMALTDGSGSLDRNAFAAAARSQTDLRRRLGADILLVIGEFHYEQWWRAGGDLGPSPTAVTTSTREAAAEILVIPHEVGHNWGMDHDRENSFSSQGTYYCNTDPSRCNFGYQDSDHMTIMSYGTNLGSCAGGPTPSNRVYVFSGYAIPDSNPPIVLGAQCGTSSGNWNRGVFEGNWNTIANYYSSANCPFFTCPNPPPATGCICSGSPATTSASTPGPISSPIVNLSPVSSAPAAPSFSLQSGEELRTTSKDFTGTGGFSVGANEQVGVTHLTGYWALVRTADGSRGWYPQQQLVPPYPVGQFRN